MKKGEAAHVHTVTVSEIVKARAETGLSQAAFAKVLDVSVRTLQDWEQGRLRPSGAANTLIKVAARHPETILEAISA